MPCLNIRVFQQKPDELWWRAYRRRKNRMRKCLGTEMILRQAFSETFREYIDKCSISGVSQIWEPKSGTKQRMTWALIFAVLAATMVYFLHYVWYEGIGTPLVVTMDSSTYPISKIDFPAVAICNINRISMKALINFTKIMYPALAKRNESFDKVLTFLTQLGRLIDYTYNSTLHNHPFLDLFNSQLSDTREIIDIMKMLAPSCDQMLMKCFWGGKPQKCENIFSVRRTTHGHCCVFNYILDYESANRPDRTLNPAKQQPRAGQFFGLYVLMDALVDDYSYNLYSRNGFEILLFDPANFPDPSGGRVIQRTVQPDQGVLIKIMSTKQIATKEVRKYPETTVSKLIYLPQIKIENTIVHNVVTSCILGIIRTFIAEKFFYLYPTGETNFDGLEIEAVDSLSCPECLPDCEHTRHFTENMKYSAMETDYKEKIFPKLIIKNVNATGKCIINIYQSASFGILNRLDVVSYWFEIVSNIGGFYGILIGYSIITIPEFCYFFIFRFAVRVYNLYVA